MYPILFKIGPVTIYTYGVFVALGVGAGYFVCRGEAKRGGIPEKVFSHIFFWALVFGFLGARIAYVLIEWKQFLNNPFRIAFGRSGFIFYGAALGVLTLFVLTKKYKINFLKSADIAALGIPLGHALGRIGCFFYGCCYGKPTASKLGILFPPESPAGFLRVKVIPTQLISVVFLLLIFCILLFLRKRKKFNGQILLSYTFLYGIFRFIIEFYRGDPRGEVFFLSTSGFISLLSVMLSIFFYFLLKRRAFTLQVTDSGIQ